MDVTILTLLLRTILTVTTVWNTVETSVIYQHHNVKSWIILQKLIFLFNFISISNTFVKIVFG